MGRSQEELIASQEEVTISLEEAKYERRKAMEKKTKEATLNLWEQICRLQASNETSSNSERPYEESCHIKEVYIDLVHSYGGQTL